MENVIAQSRKLRESQKRQPFQDLNNNSLEDDRQLSMQKLSSALQKENSKLRSYCKSLEKELRMLKKDEEEAQQVYFDNEVLRAKLLKERCISEQLRKENESLKKKLDVYKDSNVSQDPDEEGQSMLNITFTSKIGDSTIEDYLSGECDEELNGAKVKSFQVFNSR